ncbi:MAG: hypothetical protein LBC84_10405 [Prevotellaceae bacterium]|jgi:hypothetical protein|nr:hypothetical protein [Prevotellaceae bacterium]
MMKHLFHLLLIICASVACSKIEIEDDRSVRNRLPNPYSLANMQAVLDSLTLFHVELQPTDYYVRFLPRDSSQLNDLIYNHHLELFNYPLDLDIGEGEVYVDPTIPEGKPTWLYTTVKPNFEFPKEITYQVLEPCYIPPDDPPILLTRSGSTFHLENEAFKRVGYSIDQSIYPQTRSGSIPSGVIRVLDNSLDPNQYVPVQGVKIRCHTIVKWATAFTDHQGYYSIDRNFLIGPHYAIVFENNRGFDIWDGWVHITKATYNMGCHSKNGHSRDIPTHCNSWQWAVVNNSGYEYHQMCDETGITPPPSPIKIWVVSNLASSAAPMLRRVNQFVGVNSHSYWLSFLANVFIFLPANPLLLFLQEILPDIVIGTSNRRYRSINKIVFHELSHASHFSTVGSAYWVNYINYIVTYGSYGDGTGKNAQLCGIGEMWGYAMEHIQECEKYNPSLKDSLYSAVWLNNNWFKPEVFWDIYREQILTKKQIFDCLSIDVNKYDHLITKMHTLYPNQSGAIDSIFVVHGLSRVDATQQ